MNTTVASLIKHYFHNRMPKYHVTLSSGRDFIMEHSGTEYDIAYEAYEEACLMDDYLVDVELVDA